MIAFNWAATHAIAQGLVSFPPALGYLQAPKSDPTAITRLTRAVREGCDKSRANHPNIIGAELANFSAVSAWFYVEKAYPVLGYRCNFTSLGYPQTDLKSAIMSIKAVDPDFIVTLPVSQLLVDKLNRASRPVAEWLKTNAEFERITPVGDTLVIYRRRR